MATTIVKDSAGLVSALKVAKAGDVIQLQAGTYAPTAITGAKFDGSVTITSQDPTAMAKLTGLMVKDSQGLTFRGLEFVVDGAKPDHPFQVLKSKDINLDALNVHGSLDGNPLNDASALLIRESSNVSVTNSEFQDLRNGVAHMDSNGVRIEDNEFHHIRTDGVRGGGSSNVTVKNNYFTDFHTAEGDHADAIQFWTTNTTASAQNIVIEGNVVLRGSGDPIQGVFLRNGTGEIPFINVKIANNLVIGGDHNGISVESAKNVQITGNYVAGLQDHKSWIALENVHGANLSGNTSTEFVFERSTNVAQTGNTVVATPTDGGKAIQAAWLDARGQGLNLSLSLDVARIAQQTSVTTASNISLSTLNTQATNAMREIEATRLSAATVHGTAGVDSLKVDMTRDTKVFGGAGNDVITGGGVGHNTLAGGAGDDTYYVKNAFERVTESAGEGSDMVVASVDHSLAANVENLRMVDGAYLGAGNELDNRMSGSELANDLRGFGGNDLIQAGGGNDLATGGDGADTLRGGAGNDTLQGDAGADQLSGDDGVDSLAGGAGNDTLEGRAGADTLSGGAGADTFLFRDADVGSTDRIMDFARLEGDKISLRGIDSNTGVAGDQNFAFIGTKAFGKIAGELRAVTQNGNTTLMGDVNGDGVADFQVVVVGGGTLQASDFLL